MAITPNKTTFLNEAQRVQTIRFSASNPTFSVCMCVRVCMSQSHSRLKEGYTEFNDFYRHHRQTGLK